MKKKYLITLLLSICSSFIFAQEDSLSNNLLEIPRDSLLELKIAENNELTVSIASKVSENIQEAPGVVQVITKEEIDAYGYTQLYDVLNRIVGFFIFDSYAIHKTTPVMRGDRARTLYNNHVLIMINGRPLREMTFTGNDAAIISAIPVETIERIEVLRGPGSVLYGSNAFTGSLNIITKTQNVDEKIIKIVAGNQNNLSAEFTFGERSKNDYFLASILLNSDEGLAFNGTDELGEDFSLKKREDVLGMNIMAQKGKFTLTGLATYASQKHIGVVPFKDFPTTTSANTIESEFQSRNYLHFRSMIDIGYSDEKANGLGYSLNLSASILNFSFEGFPGQGYGRAIDYSIDPIIYYSGIKHLNIIAGGNIMRLKGASENLFLDYNIWWFSGFVQADYQLFNWFKIITGLQSNKPGETADWSTVPRLGVVFTPTKPLSIKALYAQAFRGAMPFETQLAAPTLTGNPDLRNENVENIDVEIAYNTPNFKISVVGYAYTQTDLIGRTAPTPDAPPTHINRGEFRGQGIEVESKIHWGNFGINASFAYQENELLGDDTNPSVTNFSLMPNLMPKFGVYYSVESKFGIGLFYNGLLSMHQPEGVEEVNPFSADVHLLSTNIFVNLFPILKINTTQELKLELFADNVLDQEVWYPEFVRRNLNSFPGYRHRLIRLGLSYQF